MDRAKTAIIHRLSPKMSIVHPWMIFFDLRMPHEVFDLHVEGEGIMSRVEGNIFFPIFFFWKR